jgi:dipeptidyl aminopeptidase/acylaminoacyl peptidase
MKTLLRSRERVISTLGILSLACATLSGHAADGTFPANEDLRHVRGLSDPRISPDGSRVLVQMADATADGGRTHLWLVDVTANTSRQLTFSPAGDKGGEHNGRWAEDGGSVVFLAKRNERVQLFRLPMSGGEAHVYDLSVAPAVDASAEPDAIPPRKAGDPPAKHDPLPIEVEDFEVAPNGKMIAIVASDPETPGEKQQKEDKADAQWVDHDLHGKRLYLLEVASGKLTNVAVAADVATITWAKQSDRLVVLVDGPNHIGDLGPETKAWLVSVAEPSHPTQIKELPPTIQVGTWSEDGTRLYFLAQAERDTPPGYSDLYSFNLTDRSILNLTRDFNGSVSGDKPLLLGGDIIQSVQIGFARTDLRIHAGKTETIHFDAPATTRLDSDLKHTGWVWLGQGSAQPTTLYYAKQLGGAARVLSTPNLLPAAWPSSTASLVHWTNDGLTIEGLLYLPPQSKSGKVPLIVDVHGGPTGAWTNSFDPLTVYFLGQGWAVLRPNPRGSTAYGAAFAAANKNDLGGGDYRDIMAGVDAVLGQYPLDGSKLALIGYSYGGEMAGFVEGNTDRFKAIISGAPVIDQHSEYGTEDESWYDRWFYGKPWEHADDAWRQSPLAHVAKAKTPFLLIQGEADVTDPLGQSQEMYRALRQAGVHVEMVQYPREGHGPLAGGMHGNPSKEPWHGFDVRQRVLKFINAAFAGQP